MLAESGTIGYDIMHKVIGNNLREALVCDTRNNVNVNGV